MFIFSAVPFELTKGKGSKLSHFLVINLSSVPMEKAYDLWFSSVATYLFILIISCMQYGTYKLAKEKPTV